jgi:hypothetical protein
LLKSVPLYDIPTVIQPTKSRDKAFHQGTLSKFCISDPFIELFIYLCPSRITSRITIHGLYQNIPFRPGLNKYGRSCIRQERLLKVSLAISKSSHLIFPESRNQILPIGNIACHLMPIMYLLKFAPPSSLLRREPEINPSNQSRMGKLLMKLFLIVLSCQKESYVFLRNSYASCPDSPSQLLDFIN